MITIAIDCGASFLKGATFEADGSLRDSLIVPAACSTGSEDVTTRLLVPVKAQALLQAVRSMLAKLSGKERCARLLIANEMHGFLLTDAKGIPQMDYLSWQQSLGDILVEGKSAVDVLASNFSQEILQTGMPLRAALPSANLLYLSSSGFLKKMTGDLWFCTLGDYILRALSKKPVLTHPTNAAASGLYDLKSGDWNASLVQIAAKGRIHFPKIGQSPLSFLLDGVSYEALPAIGDQQAALYGAGLCNFRQLSLNLGTGAQVSVLTEDFSRSGRVQIRPYLFGGYIRTLPHLPSGRSLNVYIRFLQDVLSRFGTPTDESRIWQVFLDAAANAKGKCFDVDMSFFENPCSKRLTGLLAGFKEHDFDLGTLAASILHAMAKNFLWATEQVRTPDQPTEELLFSGGVARRLKGLREKIAAGYPTAKIRIAKDETLYGLWRYAKQAF